LPWSLDDGREVVRRVRISSRLSCGVELYERSMGGSGNFVGAIQDV
jgi:hypothetical protein